MYRMHHVMFCKQLTLLIEHVKIWLMSPFGDSLSNRQRSPKRDELGGEKLDMP
jgi:hypothetical protein